ncbi:MAG: lipocalin family protein [Gammaproteobacteria bacterium]|nr:lipocalin family protein [Gammaproteobacteria bacterium]
MKLLIIITFMLFLQACSFTPDKPVPLAKSVDLNRFMGDWYVIANIPTFIEKGAHNAIESYALNEDGSIATTFRFNQDSFDGELKTYKPTGFVSDHNNSEWGMQFIWPIKAEFLIAYLSDDYQHTIIARSARDYLWVMSRSPDIDDDLYESLVQRSVDMGYSREQIQKVPHQSSSLKNKSTILREAK